MNRAFCSAIFALTLLTNAPARAQEQQQPTEPQIVSQEQCTLMASRVRGFWAQHSVLQSCFQAEMARSTSVEWEGVLDELSLISGVYGESPNLFRCRYQEQLMGSPDRGHCVTLFLEHREGADQARRREGVHGLFQRAREAYRAGRIEEAQDLHQQIMMGLYRAEQHWLGYERARGTTRHTALVMGGLAAIGGIVLCGPVAGAGTLAAGGGGGSTVSGTALISLSAAATVATAGAVRQVAQETRTPRAQLVREVAAESTAQASEEQARPRRPEQPMCAPGARTGGSGRTQESQCTPHPDAGGADAALSDAQAARRRALLTQMRRAVASERPPEQQPARIRSLAVIRSDLQRALCTAQNQHGGQLPPDPNLFLLLIENELAVERTRQNGFDLTQGEFDQIRARFGQAVEHVRAIAREVSDPQERMTQIFDYLLDGAHPGGMLHFHQWGNPSLASCMINNACNCQGRTDIPLYILAAAAVSPPPGTEYAVQRFGGDPGHVQVVLYNPNVPEVFEPIHEERQTGLIRGALFRPAASLAGRIPNATCAENLFLRRPDGGFAIRGRSRRDRDARGGFVNWPSEGVITQYTEHPPEFRMGGISAARSRTQTIPEIRDGEPGAEMRRVLLRENPTPEHFVRIYAPSDHPASGSVEAVYLEERSALMEIRNLLLLPPSWGNDLQLSTSSPAWARMVGFRLRVARRFLERTPELLRIIENPEAVREAVRSRDDLVRLVNAASDTDRLCRPFVFNRENGDTMDYHIPEEACQAPSGVSYFRQTAARLMRHWHENPDEFLAFSETLTAEQLSFFMTPSFLRMAMSGREAVPTELNFQHAVLTRLQTIELQRAQAASQPDAPEEGVQPAKLPPRPDLGALAGRVRVTTELAKTPDWLVEEPQTAKAPTQGPESSGREGSTTPEGAGLEMAAFDVLRIQMVGGNIARWAPEMWGELRRRPQYVIDFVINHAGAPFTALAGVELGREVRMPDLNWRMLPQTSRVYLSAFEHDPEAAFSAMLRRRPRFPVCNSVRDMVAATGHSLSPRIRGFLRRQYGCTLQ